MIIFRCPADSKTGMGHLMRCRALAYELADKGESCVMIGPDPAYSTTEDQQLFSDWIARPEWSSPAQDAMALVKDANAHSASFAVLDDYRVDEDYQLTLRTHGLRWLQFDGSISKPLWADVILNSSPAASREAYLPLLKNTQSRVLTGPQYAILRREFAVQKKKIANAGKQVLITFGGGDDRGGILFVLRALLSFAESGLRFLVVSGAGNPRNAEIADWINANADGRVRLLIDPPSMASAIASCSLAVLSAGMSVYEVASCGLPMLLLSIADNQTTHAMAWDKMHLARFAGELALMNEKEFQSEFASLLQHHASQQNETTPIVDGLGASRVAQVILTEGCLQ